MCLSIEKVIIKVFIEDITRLLSEIYGIIYVMIL